MQRKKFHTNLTFHNFKHKYICENMQLVNETQFLQKLKIRLGTKNYRFLDFNRLNFLWNNNDS